MFSRESYSDEDDFRRFTKVTYLDGRTETRHYDCCGVDWGTDRNTVLANYEYDDFHRLISESRLGLTTSRDYDALNRVIVVKRAVGDTPEILHQYCYDTSGALRIETNAFGVPTYYTYTYASTGKMVDVSYADGGSSTEVYWPDGRLKSLTGTAVRPMSYAYDVENIDGAYREYVLATKLDASYNPTTEWTKTYYDALGRAYKTAYADGSCSLQTYNSYGQLKSDRDPDNVVTLYSYNDLGEMEMRAIAMNRDDKTSITPAGLDRITKTVSDFINDPAHGWVRSSRTYVWTNNNTDSPLLISENQSSCDGLHSWSYNYNQLTESVTTFTGNTQTVTITAPDLSKTVKQWVNGQLISVVTTVGTTPIQSLIYGYDLTNRVNAITDGRNGTTIVTYTNGDLVSTVTTPSAGPGQQSQNTTHVYDGMGREYKTVLPDNSVVNAEYYPSGLLKTSSGSRTYRSEYQYNAQQRMTQLTTYRTYPSIPEVTKWEYHAQLGFLAKKTYPDLSFVTYVPTSAGRVQSRTSARNVQTTYHHTEAGDVDGITYSDGTTPSVNLEYNRRGQISKATRGTVETRIDRNLAGQIMLEGITGGFQVTNGYDALLRRTSIYANTVPATRVSYGYDGASRLTNVTQVNTANSQPVTAYYEYIDNSPLIGRITLLNNGAIVLSRTNVFDNLNRLTSISTRNAQGAILNSFTYQYNRANQRMTNTLADGSHWDYNYDNLGQLTSGKRSWSGGPIVAGEQYEYAFDEIGNRTSTRAGGDAYGNVMRTATYTPNAVNQYSLRTVPGGFDVIGSASPTAKVTVNDQPTTRNGTFFRGEISVNNQNDPVWQSVSVVGVTNTGTTDVVTTKTGNVFVPKASEIFTNDVDGNLLTDGRWTYTWDAENRLSTMVTRVGGSVPQQKIAFDYDWQGRRVRKQVWNNWTGTSGTLTLDRRFIYDGWNLVATYDALANSLTNTYAWGTDLSGRMQGAGGVGGLLWASEASSSQITNFFLASYDGNGNVAAYFNTNATPITQLEYGPFGEFLRGDIKRFHFGFSTKFTDDEIDLLYYGYRYYNPSTGRFVNRDPIWERGGLNLYGFVFNDSIDRIDSDGRAPSGRSASNASIPLPNDRNDLSRSQYDQLTAQCGIAQTENRRKLLDNGCIGVCEAAQGQDATNLKWPELYGDTKCYKTEPEARKRQCSGCKRKVVFSKQGTFKDGKTPTQSADGTVPNDSVGSNANGTFNYVTVGQLQQKEWYVWADHGAMYGPQTFTVSKAPCNDEHYADKIWCTTCVK